MQISRTKSDGTTESAFVYSDPPDTIDNMIAVSKTVPQNEVKDKLYEAFVRACQDGGFKSGKSEMSLPIGKILDLL